MAQSNSTARERDNGKTISTGNPEMDKKLSEGLPTRSFTIVEGANGTGKSIITSQLLWGGLKGGYSFAIYTTEKTIKNMLEDMEILALDISDYYAWGYLKIFYIDVEHVRLDGKIVKNFMRQLIDHIKTLKEEVIIIDSFTVFTICSSQDDIFNFFTECKSICNSGKTIIVTLHTYAFDEDTLARIRSIADGHIKLRIEQVGDKNVNMMEVAKIRGAKKISGNVVSFEVHAGAGLKVVPYASVQI
jgi:flagellar protein FlaH